MTLTPYDPEFEDKWRAARRGMVKYRNTLRELCREMTWRWLHEGICHWPCMANRWPEMEEAPARVPAIVIKRLPVRKNQASYVSPPCLSLAAAYALRHHPKPSFCGL